MKISLAIASMMIGTLLLVVVVNESYSQVSKEVERISNFFNECVAEDYLANQTNLKIISVLLKEGLEQVPCIDDVNQYLETGFTIKGTLMDRYIILEKIK